MNDTKKELADLAVRLCMPMLQRTAGRIHSHSHGFSIDRAGYACSELENLCRPFLGMAPVIREYGGDYQITSGEETRPLAEWLKETLIRGFDVGNPYGFERGRASMGDTFFYNQSITELSLLLVAIYLARESFWDPLTGEEKDRLAGPMVLWAKKALDDSWPNNHLWFPVLALSVMRRLGYEIPNYQDTITETLDQLDGMYLGNGWFQDGEFGRFDYYIAWSHHLYPLLWSLIEDPSFPMYEQRRESYRKRTEEYLPYYMHFFDRDGANVLYGRSLSYRFAASAIFPVAALAGCRYDFGVGRKLMFQNIESYMSSMELDLGSMPPGITYANPSFVESYTSDGGAYWAAKTFFAIFIPDDHEFWQTPAGASPIERGDFMVAASHPRVHWILEGNREYSGITLYNNTSHYVQNQIFLHHFNDMGAYYSKFVYNSRAGFAVSCRDLVSFDNMISLATKDQLMASHRSGFEDLGVRDGVMLSSHIPFSNDQKTHIETALIPGVLGEHFRIHRVTLSQPYRIREGGFSIPFYEDDYRTEWFDDGGYSGIRVHTPQMESCLKYFGEVPVHLYTEFPKPGNHALAPMAGYPAYETEELERGVYYMASGFALSVKRGKGFGMVQYKKEGDRITLSGDGKVWEVDFEDLFGG